MKTVVVIPARLGATRLPRKPLRDLAGEPLVLRVWRRVERMGVADRVVVATDHEEVARVVRAAGADVVMTSSDCASGTARVAEVSRNPEFASYDAFVNVQGDEPFISAGFIGAAADVVRSGKFTLGTVAAGGRGDQSARVHRGLHEEHPVPPTSRSPPPTPAGAGAHGRPGWRAAA